MAEDKKTPQKASNIFHSIMKASVKPKNLSNEEIILAVKKRFNAEIEKGEDGFVLVGDLTPKHELVKEIDVYIQKITKNGI
jgi:hypothetical protein